MPDNNVMYIRVNEVFTAEQLHICVKVVAHLYKIKKQMAFSIMEQDGVEDPALQLVIFNAVEVVFTGRYRAAVLYKGEELFHMGWSVKPDGIIKGSGRYTDAGGRILEAVQNRRGKVLDAFLAKEKVDIP